MEYFYYDAGMRRDRTSQKRDASYFGRNKERTSVGEPELEQDLTPALTKKTSRIMAASECDDFPRKNSSPDKTATPPNKKSHISGYIASFLS